MTGKLWLSQSNRRDLSDGYAVIGLGRFGLAVCEELVRWGAEVLAIDDEERAVDELRQVDCTDEEAMREAGVLQVGTVVVAIAGSIEASITATLIAKDAPGSRVKQVIARANSDIHMKMLQRVGADRVVYPLKLQGQRLGEELVRPNLLERLELDADHSIEEILVPEAFSGQSLRELNLRRSHHVTVLAAGPQHAFTVNPPASLVLQAGERLVVMGSKEALSALPAE